jgi:Flp pilus assembly protein TadG
MHDAVLGVSIFVTREIMTSFGLAERLQSGIRPVRNLFRRLGVNESGVAAIEFAFIAPIMFFMLIGTVELSQAITVDRRVLVAASTTADLVAREDTLTQSQIDVYMKVIKVLLAPYDSTALKVTVLSVGVKDTNQPARICWKYDFPATAPSTYAQNQTYTLPVDIIKAGETGIVTEVSYTYTPLIFSYFIKTAFPLKEKFYLKPRVSNFVKYKDATGKDAVFSLSNGVNAPGTPDGCYFP